MCASCHIIAPVFSYRPIHLDVLKPFDGSIEPWYAYRVSDSHSALTLINVVINNTNIMKFYNSDIQPAVRQVMSRDPQPHFKITCVLQKNSQ